jgi:hypothetical protein
MVDFRYIWAGGAGKGCKASGEEGTALQSHRAWDVQLMLDSIRGWISRSDFAR